MIRSLPMTDRSLLSIDLPETRTTPGALISSFFQGTAGRIGHLRFTARGISMTPFIRDGDVITLRASRGARLRTGSVVAYIHPDSGQLLVHRLFARKDGLCVTRGDNAPGSDGLIPERQVVATVTRVERNGKTVRFGIGAEGYLIVLLLRLKVLYPILAFLRAIAGGQVAGEKQDILSSHTSSERAQ